MASNTIILTQPTDGDVLNHEVPEDSSARLNYDRADIEGLSIGSDGELVMTFENGGQVNITNFESFVENGNLLYLEDGTLIDASILTNTPLKPQALNTIETAAGDADAIIQKPAANTTQEITVENGVNYVCDFDPANAALVEVKDGQMVLTFADGSQVVINNYNDAIAGQLPEELTVAEAAVIEDEILTEVTEVEQPSDLPLEVAVAQEEPDAEQVANIEPAAGDDIPDAVAQALGEISPAAGETAGSAGGNSGYGFGSSADAVNFNAPGATGPLGATSLSYDRPSAEVQAERPDDAPVVVSQVPTRVDESNSEDGKVEATGQFFADAGDDGLGSYSGTGGFNATGATGENGLTSNGVEVVVTYDAATNTYTGDADGTTVFTLEINPLTGAYTYIQCEPLDHNDPEDENEEICLDFGAQITDSDGDSDTGTITIKVADDAPEAEDVTNRADESDGFGTPITGDLDIDAGYDGDVEVCGNNQFSAGGHLTTDGQLTSCGEDVNVNFNAATNTYTGVADGKDVFTLSIDPETGSYTFTLLGPLDHGLTDADNEAIQLSFGYKVIDSDGDESTAAIKIVVLDDAPEIAGTGPFADEENLVTGNITIDGTLDHDFGNDGAGTITVNGESQTLLERDGTPSQLTSGGQPVTITTNGNGYVGQLADGTDVFTFTVNPTTGAYTYTQLEAVDHPDAGEDKIWIQLGVTITDKDGDTDTTFITIDIEDSVPVAVDDGPVAVDESQTVTGNVTNNDTLSGDAPNVVMAVTFNGEDTAVPATGSVTVTGTYGVLTISADGTYSYTANADNPEGSDVFSYMLKDADGDTDTADLTFTVSPIDDVPVFVSPQETVDETDLPGVIVNGQIDVNYGTDKPGEVCGTDSFASSGSRSGDALTSGGVPVVVTFNETTNTYTGVAGDETIFTMDIDEDGSYRFELTGTLDHADATNPNDIINLDFGIKAVDGDGDVTEDTIRVRVKDDVPTIGDSSGDVDETNFDNGPLTYTDIIDTDFGQDLGAVAANDTSSSSVPLTSNGVPVTVSSTGNTYTGVANGVTVFTLVVDPQTGEYTYTQFENLDHPDATDLDDVISIDFGVVVNSTDGDSDTGTITINVADDGPIAENDISGGEEGQLITGDVTANDDLSTDEQNTVTNVRFDGTDFPITAGTPTVVTGDFGTLTINNDGTYTYVTNDNDPDGTDVFTYTLVDNDGDSDTANLSIRVTPDGQPVAVNEMLAVDETNVPDNGPLEFTGTLDVDFGLDGFGKVEGNGEFNSSGSLKGGTLTSNDVPVTVTQNGNTYTGVAGAETVFTLTINNDGTYAFNLFTHLDHADDTDPNDLINLEFGVMAMDADGDTADGTVTIQVYDDAPVAYDDGTKAVIEEQAVTGNVTDNDDLSEDAPNNVTAVIFNGTSTTVPATGSVNIAGEYGVLTISADGTYSYLANGNNPEGVDTFTYALTDFDGDTDTAEISFNVTPDNDVPVVVTPTPGRVDETNLDDGNLTVTGTIQVDYGNDGPGTVSGNDTFTSSETNLTSCDKPVVVTYDAQTGMYVGTAGGDVVFTMTINANGSYNFTQFAAIDHPDSTNPNDAVTLNFGAQATDSDGDSTNTTISVVVLDDGPVIGNKTNAINEAGLDDAASISVSGTVAHDYGEDGAGDITATGRFEAKYQMDGTDQILKSGGDDITVTTNANGYVGKLADGTVVFELSINSNGQYTYTQHEPVDHQGTNLTGDDDIIWLKFYVEITDKDGDTDTGVIVIDLKDDGPSITGNGLAVLESGLDNGVITANGSIRNFDFGADGAGSIKSNGEVMVRFEENGPNTTLKSGGEDVAITKTDSGYIGKLADGTTVFTVVFNSQTGTFQYKQFEPVDHNGAGDERLWIKLGVTITDGDGDTDTAFISIDIRDDVVVATDDRDSVNETGRTTGNVLTNDDAGVDAPGVVMKVTVNGQNYDVPTNGSNVSVSGQYGTLTINNTGVYSYTANNVTGDKVDVFSYTLKDSDGDTDTATLTINVNDTTVIKPTDVNGTGSTDDTVVGDNGVDVETGTINVNYNGDGPGTTMGTNQFSSSDTTLTANGVPVVVTFSNGTYTGKAGNTTVFTMTINSNGTYRFEQKEALDHSNTNSNNEGLNLVFGVKATDSDGDVGRGNVTITVRDDGPSIDTKGHGVLESALEDGPITVTGNVKNVDFGADGAGSIKSNGQVMVRFEEDGPNTTLKSGGDDVAITKTNSGYVGKLADGTTVFTLVVNPTTGAFTYKQFEPVDHNGAGDERLWIKLGVTITDGDGDTDTAFIQIDIRDDEPEAVNDSASTDEGERVSGNVLTNDDAGADAPGRVMMVSFGGQNVNVPLSGGASIDGQHGTLTIFSGGGYRYDANDAAGDNRDIFTYTLKDADGDTDTATLTINTSDVAAVDPIVLSTTGSTDDTVVDNSGRDVETGTINVDYQGEGPGTTMGTNSFSSSDTTLTANGVPVVVTFNNGVYTGKAGNTTVFTMTINSNGTYRFEQKEALDHSNTNSNNEGLNLVFGVKATDSDGDVGRGNVTITVRDDGPDARNDSKTITEGNRTTGHVFSNDDPGADESYSIMKVTFGGRTYNLSSGNTNITGDHGTLTINNSGAYTYVANQVTRNEVDQFTYTLKDGDGDTDTATLTINVTNRDYTPINVGGSGSTDDTVVGNSGSDVETGTINVDYQGDGPGTTMGTNSFSSSDTTLTANGVPVVVTFNNGVYTGKAGNTTVFTMTINSNGTYRFEQKEALDHSNTNSNNEGLSLVFGVKATDSDGDVGRGNVTITVRDDGPDAKNDSLEAQVGKSYTGNLLTNDDVGADGAVITKIVWGSKTYTVPNSGNVTINTNDGTLLVNKLGQYKYTGKDGGVDTFTYTLTDGDGDTDTATFRVHVDGKPTGVTGSGSTDDTVVDNSGRDVETGTIKVDYNGDGPGTTMGTNKFSSSDKTLTADGVPVKVTFSNGTYTGKAGNTTVFTMKINSDGTYRFEQKEALDHSNTMSTNESLNLVFGVKATDSDGDIGTGNVTITVRDDGPDAKNETITIDEFRTVKGNVISNDDVGGDASGSVMKVSFEGKTYNLPSNGSNVRIRGDHGTLEINSKGSYEYSSNNSFRGGADKFMYTLKDGDGDTDMATLTINVRDSFQPDGGGGGDGTPLVIDLDHDGIELVSQENGVYFDMGADGVLDQTGWVAPDDGLLALDVNQDGIINDHNELFGTLTEDGFSILAQHDSNDDGVIDAQDNVFDDLQIWRDANQNGYSEENELFSLGDFKIVSIDLSAEFSNEVIAGNPILLDGSLQYADGTVGDIVDAIFKYEALDTLIGTEGQDTFIFDKNGDDPAFIRDFNTGEGDVIDLSAVLGEYDAVQDSIDDFVFQTQNGDDTVILVDQTGSGNVENASAVAILNGVTDLSTEDIIN